MLKKYLLLGSIALITTIQSHESLASVEGRYVMYDAEGQIIEDYINKDRSVARRWIDATLKAITIQPN